MKKRRLTMVLSSVAAGVMLAAGGVVFATASHADVTVCPTRPGPTSDTKPWVFYIDVDPSYYLERTFENTTLSQETTTTCRYSGSVYEMTNGTKYFVYTDSRTFTKVANPDQIHSDGTISKAPDFIG